MTDYDALVLDLDGDAAMLDACLTSIERQSRPPRRIIVLDNGSRTPTVQRIAQHERHPFVRRVEMNRGFAGGANLALESAEGPFVAFVNNDVVLDEGWAEALISRLDREPRCAAVQSIVMTADGAAVDGAGIALEKGRITQLGHGQPLAEVDLSRFWGVSATAAIYRRDALRSVSRHNETFDRRFFAYYEDVELAARLAGAGWRLCLVREPLARHRGSATAGLLGQRAETLRTRNRYFVARLHPAIASRRTLLAEDARRAGGALRRGELVRAAAIVAAAIAGLCRPLA